MRKSVPEATIELVAGSGGIFDVEADGRKIFSKKKSGRFPETGEIAAMLGGGVHARGS